MNGFLRIRFLGRRAIFAFGFQKHDRMRTTEQPNLQVQWIPVSKKLVFAFRTIESQRSVTSGSLHQDGQRETVNKNNLLLRGCEVRNTDYIEGIVVYAGTVYFPTLLASFAFVLARLDPCNCRSRNEGYVEQQRPEVQAKVRDHLAYVKTLPNQYSILASWNV